MRKIFTFLLLLGSLVSFSQSTTLVISQFYGAGGNNGATLNADFVELHNISGAPVSLAGMTIQYSAATNTADWTGVSPLPSVSIPAGGYYLIQMSSVGANGAALPTPDYVSNPTIAMSGTSGKVALVNALTALTGCPSGAPVVDLVGYGTANCFEGTAATAVLTTTTAGIRNNGGCAETNNNGADFTVATPAPRNAGTTISICSNTPPTATLTVGTVVDFGSVVILTNSTSQSFNLSGSNLTGAPGLISITSPSTDFQVSNDNVTWGATATVAFATATLASTPVYIRFTPQTVGPKTGNVAVSGGGASSVNVAVSGNGVATGVATVATSSLAGFGTVCVNTTAGPNSVDISGSNLTTADLVIGPLAGYSFSLTSGGTFTPSLTLTHPAGTYFQSIFVQFTPTTATVYNGNIGITGGGLAATANISVTGTGTAGTTTVSTGVANAITQVSATLLGSLPAQGCAPVTAYGFEYSTVNGFVTGTVAASNNLAANIFSANLTSLTPGTTYYYKAFATSVNGTVYGVQLSFTTLAPPPATLSATALTAFGATCVGTELGPNSFDITGNDLTVGDITVGPLNGYSFSTTATGTFTPSLTIPQAGGSFTQTVYVKFAPPSLGNYNGNIPVSGAGVAGYNVPVSGSGSNTAAAPITGDVSAVMANSAVAAGSISNAGCSPVFSYGIEYSGINGFVDGSGIRVESTNLSGADFSASLTGLVQGTTYYYKAYSSNNGGTAYGLQNSFTTASIGDGLIIYGNPVYHGQNLHYSLNNIEQGHYSVRIHNIIGQLVFQKDIITQVGFIDDNFILPGYLPIGIYRMEIRNSKYKTQKLFYVK